MALMAASGLPATRAAMSSSAVGRTLYLPLLAAPAETLVQIGQIGGRVGGLAVQGDRAFLGIGPRVVVIDLADRAHPRQVGASPVLASSVKVIRVEGRYVWAGLDSGELVGLDTAGADGPQVLSVLPVALQWWNSTGPLAVRGGFAYVGQTAGLVIVDLADPRAPRLVGGPVAGSARPYDIAVSGDHAYVSYYDSDDTPGGIDVFDVADPRSPRRVASLELTTGVFPVAAEGDVLAVIANRELWLIDIANPRDPRVAAVSGGQTEHPSFDIGLTNVSDMAMQGNTVWLASPDDDPLDQGGVVAIDIANLRSPRQMGQLRTLPADALAIAGETLVALGSSSGVDVSVVAAEPRAPRLEGSLRLFAGAYNLWLAGRVAFVAAYLDYLTDLQVVDLSTPSRPRYLGAIPISSNEVLRVADGEMWTRSTTAGVPRGTSLVRWDLADPLHPRPLGERQLEGSTGQGVGSGDWLYVTGTTGSGATRRGGVWQVHATDAARPTRFIGLLDASRGDSYPSAIAIADNRLVAASNDRVWIFDITDPDQVRELASFDLPGPAVSPVLVAEGHTAFVLRGFFGSRVFDLANPPRELSTAPWLPGRWYSLYGASVLGSGHLHVAKSPFEVWDVREPLAPRQVPAPGGWSWTGDVAMDGRLVVVASVDGGLRVLAWR
ncbi:MAG: LVIVD repeat-containing protein [Anaerolineae bacterium]